MATRQKVFSYVELDERTSIQKLGVFDQIRAMMRELFNDDSKELTKMDLVTQESLRLEANLLDFVERATAPIRKGDRRSVELKVSSRFKSVIDKVFTNPRLTNYYTIHYKMPDIPYDIDYTITVKMEAIR